MTQQSETRRKLEEIRRRIAVNKAYGFAVVLSDAEFLDQQLRELERVARELLTWSDGDVFTPESYEKKRDAVRRKLDELGGE